MCDNVYFIFSFFHVTTVLWIPENALKSRILHLEMLSLSLSVSSSPRYNCRICELQLLCKCNKADKVHFTLVPSGSGEWLQCNVLNVRPVSHFIFVLNLMWTYFSMLLSSRHFKCMHLWKCILYYRLDLWIEVALQQKNAWTVYAVFLLYSPFSLLLSCGMEV